VVDGEIVVDGKIVVEEVVGKDVVEVGKDVVDVVVDVVGEIVVVVVDVVGEIVVVVVVPSHGSHGLPRPHGSTQHSPFTGWIKKSIIP